MTSAAAAAVAAPELPALRSVTSSAAAVAISVASAAAANTDLSIDSRLFCSLCFYLSPNSSSTPDPSPIVIMCPQCPRHSLNVPETVPFPPRRWPPPSPPPNSHDSSGSSISYGTSIDSESDIGDEDEDEDEDDDDDDDDFELDDEYDSDYNCCQLTPALESFVASLPIKIFSPNLVTPLPPCSVCIDDFEINLDASRIVNELPCGHFFHKDCITDWLGRTNTCPLCRYELPVDLSRQEDDAEVADRRQDEREDVYFMVNSVSTSEAPETERRILSTNGGEPSRGGPSATNFRAMLDVVRNTFMMVDA